MSEARAAAMGKIQASIDGYAFTIDNPDVLQAVADEDMQLDEAASVQSNTELLEEQRLLQARLKTDADIQRLEDAKRRASSQAVKDELEAEARLIKAEKEKAAQEEADRRAEVATAEQAREKFNETISNTKSRIDSAADRVTEASKSAWNSLSGVATPGSIFLPVSVLIIFYLLLLPVNGHTRIEWLWLALTGNAHLTGDVPGGGADFGDTSAVQGGGADFGTNAPTTAFTGPSGGF